MGFPFSRRASMGDQGRSKGSHFLVSKAAALGLAFRIDKLHAVLQRANPHTARAGRLIDGFCTAHNERCYQLFLADHDQLSKNAGRLH
jgi:hypothetical protein